MSNAEAEENCKKGNEAFKEKKWDEAIKFYNKAVTLDPDCAKYYSNRSGAWSSKGNHDSALADATRCLERDPQFVKGFSRKGKALFDLGRWDEAQEAYQSGLALEPGNAALKQSVEDIKTARSSRSTGGATSSAAGGLGGAGGLVGNLFTKFVERVKGGGRWQLYLVIFGGYYLVTNIMGLGKAGTKADQKSGSGDVGHIPFDEETDAGVDVDASIGSLVRKFSEVGRAGGGQWISHLELGERSSSQMLFLHSTAMSAGSEYGLLLPQVAQHISKGLGTESQPLILAPDRPCHGFSTCPPGGERGSDHGKWLDECLFAVPKMKRVMVTASGREAAQLAISLAARRDDIAKVVLIRPSSPAPSLRKLSTGDEVRAWLSEERRRTLGPQALADAAHWAVSEAPGSTATEALDAESVPSDCKFAIIYFSGEEQDAELHTSLKSQGIELALHSVENSKSMVQAIVKEMHGVFGAQKRGGKAGGGVDL